MADPRVLLSAPMVYRTTDANGNVVEEIQDVDVRIITPGKTETGEVVVFTAPSAVALALDTAIVAAERVNALRSEIQVLPGPGQVSTEQWIYYGPDQIVFDCIQQAMVTVTFSYMALEAYANSTLEIHGAVPVTIKLRRRDNNRRVTKPARYFMDSTSTETKLCEIMPQLLGVESPKDKKYWKQVKSLQNDRIRIVHMKLSTSGPRSKGVGHVPSASIFYDFLVTDALWMPRAAAEMIDYLHPGESWLAPLLKRMA